MIENTKCTNVMTGHILHSSKLTCSSSSVVHESVMVSHHKSGMVFRSLFAFFKCFFESFFYHVWCFHVCFPWVFLQRVYVLNLWSRNGSINGWQRLFRQRNIPRHSWSWRWMGRRCTQHPRVNGRKNQLAVFVGGCFLLDVFFRNFIQLLVNCWFGARWFGIPGVPLSITIPFIFGNPRNPNDRAKKQTIILYITIGWIHQILNK